MADSDWFPEAIHDPGLNAGYRRGRTLNFVDVAHFTVGRDSRVLIRDRGLAAFLFPKQGRPYQFCEANAVTSHACEFNDEGCGYEVERLSWDEPFTADQTYWVGQVLRWRNARYGVPLVHHEARAGRLPIGTPFRGVADHGGLVHRACDQHTDGWHPHEWAAAVGTPTPAPEPRAGGTLDMIVTAKTGTLKGRHWLLTGRAAVEIDGKQVLQSAASGTPRTELDTQQVKALLAQYGILNP